MNRKEIEDIFNITNDAITIHDKDYNIIHANMAAEEMLGLKKNSLLSQKCYKSYHGTDCPPTNCPSCLAIKNAKPSVSEMFESHLNRYVEIRAFPSFDGKHKLTGLVHIMRDISRRKKLEEELKDTIINLKTKTEELQESIAAFKFLLKQREYDVKELQDTVLYNAKNLILPALKRLKNKAKPEDTLAFGALEANLGNILSPFSHSLSNKYLNLSPKEIEVANLVRGGFQDKDISRKLGITVDTVKAHRRNVREKLKISNRKVNLMAYLNSLSK